MKGYKDTKRFKAFTEAVAEEMIATAEDMMSNPVNYGWTDQDVDGFNVDETVLESLKVALGITKKQMVINR